MSARLPTYNDQPSFQCQLGREPLVEKVARQIADGRPPLVFGIHGDWGSGKTSFLCQLEHALTGACTLHAEAADVKRSADCRDIKNVFTVWFEAWRYQNETSPVVALLHEIRRQLPRYEKLKKALIKGGHIMAKGIFGALDEVGVEVEAGKLIASTKVGLKIKNPLGAFREESKLYDEEHLSKRLSTDQVQELLRDTLSALLGTKDPAKGRVCIFIDDLDRCDPAAALKLLEGIKIYLSLPQCVFVIGVNSRQVERAIAPYLPGSMKDDPDQQRAEASEYLEKLCTFTWKLPFLSLQQRAATLARWLAPPPESANLPINRLPKILCDAIQELVVEYDCLPANPRKIKSLANTVFFLATLRWDAAAGQEIAVSAADSMPEAARLLVSATIYHFFPDLLRFLQAHELAWNDFTNHLLMGGALAAKSDFETAVKFLRFQDLASTVQQQKSPTPGPQDLSATNYYDPVDLRVFRVQKLLLAGLQMKSTTNSRRLVGPMDAPSMRPYLMIPTPAGPLAAP